MVTFLSGGTGTPKLLTGLSAVFDPLSTTVIANTGDDIELSGLFVCPDVDTVLYHRGGLLDTQRWWGIEGDTTNTHDEVTRLAEMMGLPQTPQYLPAERQRGGRPLARWRRFAGTWEFMQLGDRDRAIHTIRTGLLDAGQSLTAVTRQLAAGFDLDIELLPMSNDPVASLIHTPDGLLHFQEFWVDKQGTPTVEDVEFRGADKATLSPPVRASLQEPVVIGPSNPVTSIGPMLAIEGMAAALERTPVVAVSPFVGETVFSGPAAKLMDATGLAPSTAGLLEAYPFVDALVVDSADDITSSAVHIERTDITIDTQTDARRVMTAVARALNAVQPGVADR